MSEDVLLRNNTREQRMRIVAKGLDWCGDASCDLCSGCSLGAGSLEAMYQPYIDGKLELAEVNMLHAATKFVHG
jgi:NADH:ubiquinone oxidoreductase subunit F (NADH-binding)